MKSIGIIGYGNMGSSIAERIKDIYKVYIFDKDKTKINNFVGINVANSLQELLINIEVLVLAIKPQDFDSVLDEIKDKAKDKIIISIAAGITTNYIEKVLGVVRVIRVMPNLPVKIGEGISCLAQGKFASLEDLDFVEDIFEYLGETLVIDENQMNAVTAISGSGPAYILFDMESKKIDPLHVPKEIEQIYVRRLEEAAEKVGLDSYTAATLATCTTASTIHLSAQSTKSGMTPTQLRVLITSKGGTTEEAIKVLVSGGSWADAAVAAKNRAKELSKE